MSGLSALFSIDTTTRGDHQTVTLHGDLDLLTAPRLAEALRGACEGGATELVLDLHDIEFVDSAGLRAILLGQSYCGEHGCRFLIDATLPGAVKRLFAVAGVGDLFSFSRPPGAPDEYPPESSEGETR